MGSPTPRSRPILLATVLAAAGMPLASCGSGPPTGEAVGLGPPPPTREVDVVDDYHGEPIGDPFRWLEDQDGEEVLAWADAQNAYSERFLSRAADRAAIEDRLTGLWDHAKWSAPSHHGPWWIWSKNDGLQNQAVLYRATSPGVPGEVLLDPNGLSADGTVALGATAVSEDGRHLAYSLSEAGSDWVEWRVLEVASGRVLEDRLRWSKFSGAAWTHDGRGFFYQRYQPPAEGAVHEAPTRGAMLCYHLLGSDQQEDRIVYERPDEPDWGFGAKVTDDGRFAIISISAGTDRRNRIACIDLADETMAVRPLLFDFDARWRFVELRGDEAMFVTDLDAPNGCILGVSLDDPTQRTPIVPESRDKLEAAAVCGSELIVTYLRDASHAIMRFDLDGASRGEIALPEFGSVAQLSGRREDRVLHFVSTTFTRPGSVLAFDLDRGELTTLREPDLPYDPDAFEVQQVGFQGADGSALRMFLMHRKGLRLDRDNPVLLYGYGGFGLSLTPRFSVQSLVFCERGGVYAQATLRGGGEYGSAWHEAGMLTDKQRVFDDFTAAARYLLRNDYTVPAKLAIHGASNGGLLVGACLVQHPELFGAAIPEVGVLDMLRYHRFTIGWAWAAEYGRSDDPEMFPTLRAYSPLHNVRDGVCYPPTLVMTGDHDDRVLPGHSYKFAARLQQAQGCDAPILLRVTRRAGHGGGKPTSFRIAEAADRLAFLGLTIGTR